MSNSYTWSYVSHTTRAVANVPSNGGGEPQTVIAVDCVRFTCTADDGAGHTGTFTDRIYLGDPVTVETALTDNSLTADLLEAAKTALGLGGVERWQQNADALVTKPAEEGQT